MTSQAVLLLFLPLILANVSVPTQEIAPNVEMPIVSIGTWTQTSQNSSLIVNNWMNLGGRGIDSAWVYFTQKDIAAVIKASDVKREDIFITTKIPSCFLEETFVNDDLKALGTDYIDLLLLHFPLPFVNCSATWKTLEGLQQKGTLRSIGVSNFKIKDLEALLETATIAPAVNQIEYNVFSHDDELVQYCSQHNITVEAYSPLGSPGRQKSSVFTDPTIGGIAKAHNVSAAQVALRWIVQAGHILTVLSEETTHQENDADIFSFELTKEEMTILDGLQNYA